MRKLIVLMLLLFVLGLPLAQAQEDTFALTIMHTNDTHAAHDPNSNGDGGAARQATVQNQIRESVANSILVDAGDRFSGTLYHTTYVGQDQVLIMNALGYDAMTLGNHEFDNGDDILAEFIAGLDFPVVTANMDFSASESLNGLVVPYVILDVNGQQVGVIGLNTADTVEISSPGDEIIFSDDYAGVANEAAAELTEQGVNKIILLTHTGIGVDLDFIESLDQVDVVVGGHSHTLLSNQNTANFPYPMVFDSAAGEPILYVQSLANGQYLGRLNVVFNADGVLTSWNGDSIFLSRYIAVDPEVEAILAELRPAIEELIATPTGASTEIDLEGNRDVCRVEECTLGNMIADAMRWETAAEIAIMNSGGVRASIPAGDITLGTVLTVHPFGNQISTFDATGADIIAALENGVTFLAVDGDTISRADLAGRFPQVSGLQVTFDITQEPGSRVVEVLVEDSDLNFVPIDPEAVYYVVTNNFMRAGGDGYSMFAENAMNPYDFGRLDYEVTADYLAWLGTITADTLGASLEGRINYVNALPAPR